MKSAFLMDYLEIATFSPSGDTQHEKGKRGREIVFQFRNEDIIPSIISHYFSAASCFFCSKSFP